MHLAEGVQMLSAGQCLFPKRACRRYQGAVNLQTELSSVPKPCLPGHSFWFCATWTVGEQSLPRLQIAATPHCSVLSCWIHKVDKIRKLCSICTLKVILPCKYTQKNWDFYSISAEWCTVYCTTAWGALFQQTWPVSWGAWGVTSVLWQFEINVLSGAVGSSKRINKKCLPRAHIAVCQGRRWCWCTFLVTVSYSPSFSKAGSLCSWWTDLVLEYSDVFEVMDLSEECMCK